MLAYAVVALLFMGAMWLFVLFPFERGPGDGHAVEVVIPADVSAEDLAHLLATSGLVRSPRVFGLWVRLSGGTQSVAPGVHLLTDGIGPKELMARIERKGFGGSARVTFPEGFNRFDMARRLQDKHVATLRSFLDASADAALLGELGITGSTAEGFLFPASYDFPLDADAHEIVKRMKLEFDRRWDLLARAHSASLTDVMASWDMGVRDVVTLASMIEKEAAVDDERATIASVFLNRLRSPTFHPRRLESDPTASYGCLAMPEKAPSCATFTGKATAAIEHDPDNPYSTYTHEGLPPGPIANPGAKALEAAMTPANTQFFYFVARGEGRHTFSETYDAHLAAVHGANRSTRSLPLATAPPLPNAPSQP